MMAQTVLSARRALTAGPFFGVGMVMLYNLLSSAKEVVSGAIVQRIDPIALTAVVFALVTLFFQASARIGGREVYSKPFSDRPRLLALNLFSCGAWIGFFYSVRYLEPAIVSALMVGVGPALATLLIPIWYRPRKIRPLELVGSIGILLASIYILGLVTTGNSSLGYLSAHDIAQGGVSALLGSICMVGASIFSKRLSDSGCEPVAIMAHRFYLLVAATLIISIAARADFPALTPYWAWIVGLALLGVIVPLWALQHGIRNLDPLLVMILISTAPAFTFAIQLLDPRLSARPAVLAGVGLLCAFAAVSQLRLDPGRPAFPDRR